MLKAKSIVPSERAWKQTSPVSARSQARRANSTVRRLAREAKQLHVSHTNTQNKELFEQPAMLKNQQQWAQQRTQAALPRNTFSTQDETSILVLDQRIKELENSFSSEELAEDKEWRNLPRICTRHEVAEAKRLAKLINPERWREIFLAYCAALLRLRSARPKRWSQRDSELEAKWWYAPWYKIESSEAVKHLGPSIRLGFDNLIASDHIERQRSLLNLDLSSQKLGPMHTPEAIASLLLSVGSQFNAGCLGYYTRGSTNCPKEVYALIKLFLRRCSDKGVIFDAGNIPGPDATETEPLANRIARGHMFAWPELSDKLKQATRNESGAPLYEALKSLEKAPKNVAACTELYEQEEAHVALSIFSAFMLPICPIINSDCAITPQSQSANILTFMNRQWKEHSALRSSKVHAIKHNNPHVFAVVKACSTKEESDMLMLANFANHEAEVELPLRNKQISNARTVHAGSYDEALTVCDVSLNPQTGRPSFVVPARGVLLAKIKHRS